jgi:hypothetical protein
MPEPLPRRRTLRITDEQFRLLFDTYPDDPELIAEACREALYSLQVPSPTGRWPKYDVRVYVDNGFNGSGYLLIHWEDAHKVPGCLSNGFMSSGGPGHADIEWDDQPERERIAAIRSTLQDWAYD